MRARRVLVSGPYCHPAHPAFLPPPLRPHLPLRQPICHPVVNPKAVQQRGRPAAAGRPTNRLPLPLLSLARRRPHHERPPLRPPSSSFRFPSVYPSSEPLFFSVGPSPLLAALLRIGIFPYNNGVSAFADCIIQFKARTYNIVFRNGLLRKIRLLSYM